MTLIGLIINQPIKGIEFTHRWVLFTSAKHSVVTLNAIAVQYELG